MTRTLTFLLTFFLLAFATTWAADSPIVGKWDCTSSDDAGQSYSWTLTVKDDGGKLTGTLSGDPGDLELVDARLDGNSFTFKVVVNDNTYTVETTIDGNKIEGKYKGAEANGTLKGTKQS
ncbi:MAG: hypothetical protein U0Q18_14205 [Bryobacteraceae bacterium]